MENLRLTLDVFGVWLQQRINEHPDMPKFLVAIARQPDMPDRCTTILRVGAGKDQYDGYFEEVPFRIQTRGRSESVEDAELFTMVIDDIIDKQAKRAMMPVIRQGNVVGNIWVADSRAVNKPKQMPITDKQSRYQFTADYMLLASRFNEEA
jgi:hypothetical protein